MRSGAVVALVLALVLIAVLVVAAFWPRRWSETSARTAEVYLYRPPNGGYYDYRHAYTDAVEHGYRMATPDQVHEAARAGAYWLGVGFASDGALYAFDGRGVPRRYDQDAVGDRRRFGVLLYGAKPPITEQNAERVAPWNEQGHGHLPVWSRHAQQYPNQYKNRTVQFGGGGGGYATTVVDDPVRRRAVAAIASPASPASPPAPLPMHLTSPTPSPEPDTTMPPTVGGAPLH